MQKIDKNNSQLEFISQILQFANIIFKNGNDLHRSKTLYLLNKISKEIENTK